MNKLRRSYEARVLLVPLGASAERLVAEMASEGLDGIECLFVGEDFNRVRPLAARGWWNDGGEADPAHVVAAADMAVLLARDLTEASPVVCHQISAAAEAHGVLIAALLVGSDHGAESADSFAGDNAMVALRESTDMLVTVRSLRLATPFLDVLRGGARDKVQTIRELPA